MAKFNSPVTTKTTNHEGAVAFTMPRKEELVSLVVNSFVSDSFYEPSDERLERLRSLVREIAQNDPMFIAKLAVYARQEMNLRSMPVVLVVELARVHQGDNLVSRAVTQIIERVDDMTELLAYYALSNNRTEVKKLNKLSKQIQKGLRNVFFKFDTYSFAKYNRAKSVTIKDVAFLTHPKPVTAEQEQLLKNVVKDTLPVPDTWEVAVSAEGNTKAVWERLVAEKKLGYMATLRNLRNMVNANVSEATLVSVINYLTNADAIKKSKQMPFRFFSAYRELLGSSVKVPALLDALDTASHVSAVNNMPWISPDKSYFIAVDVSGSMDGKLSQRGTVSYRDIAMLQAVTVAHVTEKITFSMFGERFGIEAFPTNARVCSTAIEMQKRAGKYGHSTNGYLVIEHLIRNRMMPRYVMIFTDCQLYSDNPWGGKKFSKLWSEYKKINPDAELILFNLAGYSTTPISVNREDVTQICGWSDRIYQLLDTRDFSTVIEKVEKMVI